MHDPCTYDYAIIRVVPKVEREEFINVGVIVSCPARKYLEARIELDEPRLLALDPGVDIEFIKSHLSAFMAICAGGENAGPIGKLSQRERFHWLVAPRSTIIQTSPVHTGRCRDSEAVIEHLLNTMVRREIADPAQAGAYSASDQDKVTVKLSQAEALVLFEFCSRFTEQETLAMEDQAEERALWNLTAALEKILLEPFLPDYDERVEEARKKLRDK